MSGVFDFVHGDAPLVVSLPHVGTSIPEDQRHRYLPRAFDVEDTDWHLQRLYGFVPGELGASLIAARASRYVIDLNRPPENTPMYPGANNTGLVPTRFFTGEPLYREGHEPDDAEVRRRIDAYWRPYHEALSGELQRLVARHGRVVLFDGHSIKSELPWLFEGRLPDLNLGCAAGTSCDPSLRDALAAVLADQHEFTHVVDGRFKGGHITRHYGRPRDGVHAVQLEMCWRCYMDERPPYAYDEVRAARVLPLVRRLLRTCVEWARRGA